MRFDISGRPRESVSEFIQPQVTLNPHGRNILWTHRCKQLSVCHGHRTLCIAFGSSASITTTEEAQWCGGWGWGVRILAPSVY